MVLPDRRAVGRCEPGPGGAFDELVDRGFDRRFGHAERFHIAGDVKVYGDHTCWFCKTTLRQPIEPRARDDRRCTPPGVGHRKRVPVASLRLRRAHATFMLGVALAE